MTRQSTESTNSIFRPCSLAPCPLRGAAPPSLSLRVRRPPVAHQSITHRTRPGEGLTQPALQSQRCISFHCSLFWCRRDQKISCKLLRLLNKVTTVDSRLSLFHEYNDFSLLPNASYD